MKKNRFTSYLALGVVFVLLNIIALVTPTQKMATFWIAYIFTIIAFAAQILVWKLAFGNKETLKSKFLGIPVIHVGIFYLIIQLIAFLVFMIFPIIPEWLTVVVCAIILAGSVLCMIAGEAGAKEINRVEEKVKIKRYFIESLQVDIEMLADSESDSEIKTALKKLAEKVRFSDPMSHEMLGELESRITATVEEMKIASDKKALIAAIDLLLLERNKKCKILK